MMSDVDLRAMAATLIAERYILRDDAGASPGVDDPALHYGVWDRLSARWAILPDATYCWGQPIDRALDCLNELRGGMDAERGDD